jgi:uncharacterized Zn-finger protein
VSDEISQFNVFSGFFIKPEVIDIEDDDDEYDEELPLLEEIPPQHFSFQEKRPKKKLTMFRCNLCPKTYKHKITLQRHQSETHFGKRYQCPYCEYKCARKYYLTTHMTTHVNLTV